MAQDSSGIVDYLLFIFAILLIGAGVSGLIVLNPSIFN